MPSFREQVEGIRNAFPKTPSERLSNMLGRVRSLTKYVDDLNAYAETASIDEDDLYVPEGDDLARAVKEASLGVGDGAQLVGDRMLVGLARDIPRSLLAAIEMCEFFEQQIRGLNRRAESQVTAIRALKTEKKILERQLADSIASVEKTASERTASLVEQLKDSEHMREDAASQRDSFRQERDAIRSSHDKVFGQLTELERKLTEYDPGWKAKLEGVGQGGDTDDLDWIADLRVGGLGE